MCTYILLPMIILMSMFPDGKADKFKKMGIDEVRYSFHDSSVPPPYHRSYTISLNADTVSIVVDSYGDIIADTSFAVEAGKLGELIDLMDQSGIDNQNEKKENEGCTGGTGETLECLKDGASLFRGSAYYCAGNNYGTLKGEMIKVKTFMIGLIPDFSKVLDRQ